MALSQSLRHKLGVACGNRAAGDRIADLVDTAASGTLAADDNRKLRIAMARQQTAALAIAGIEASTAITDQLTLRGLDLALASHAAEVELNAGL